MKKAILLAALCVMTFSTQVFSQIAAKAKTIQLDENGKIEIAIGDIAISDENGNNLDHATFAFTGTPTLSGSVSDAKISIINEKLVYDLTEVAKSVEAFADEITYKIKDSTNEATGTIHVTINHKNDIAPVANNDVVTAYVGVTISIITLTDNDTDADVVPNGYTAVIEIGSIVNQPSNSKITVVKIDDKAVEIKIDPDYDPDVDGYTVEFTYNIQDPTDYDADVNTSANVGTVTINIERMPDDVPIPVSDVIIVNEGTSASALWTGIASLIANDKASKNGSVVDEAQLVSGAARGTITVNSDGTFEYTDNGNEFPFDDGFMYKVKAANGQWSVIDTYVRVIINPLNDNKPVLTEKHEKANAETTYHFTVIDETDTDIDYGTMLKLSSVSSPDPNAEVSIVNDSTISFRYNQDFDALATVVVNYEVKDSVDYIHHYNNGGVLDSKPYNDYTLTAGSLTVVPNSNDATLASLTVSEGTLTPTFSSEITQYDVNLSSSIRSISITAINNDIMNAIITGNVTDYPLSANDTTFVVTVTAEDGITKKEYKINLIIDNGLSIVETQQGSMKLFPNPVNDVLHIRSSSPIEQVGIYTIIGETIKQYAYPVEEINMSNLTQGIYLIEVKTEAGKTKQKILKE